MISMDQFRATSTNSPTDNPPVTNEAFSFNQPIVSSNRIDFTEDRAGDTTGTEVFFEMKAQVCEELLGTWICSNGNKESAKHHVFKTTKIQFFRIIFKCPKIVRHMYLAFLKESITLFEKLRWSLTFRSQKMCLFGKFKSLSMGEQGSKVWSRINFKSQQ